MRLHWNGCGLLLHELCHLIHQFALKDGLYNEVVLNTFKIACESGLYEETLRRDWAGLEEDSDMGKLICVGAVRCGLILNASSLLCVLPAYAMLDHKVSNCIDESR
jgi:hypothetical protein